MLKVLDIVFDERQWVRHVVNIIVIDFRLRFNSLIALVTRWFAKAEEFE